MKTSPTIGAIAKAVAAAQREMQNPVFDSLNPHFRSKFASLAAVRNAVIPVMAKHGVSVTQELVTVDGGIACTTILMHESGEWLAYGPFTIAPSKDDAQGRGSASIYVRRYSLQSVAGVVGVDDDDGNAATESATITAEQAADLAALIDDVGADRAKFCRYLNVDALENLPAARYADAVRALEAKRK